MKFPSPDQPLPDNPKFITAQINYLKQNGRRDEAVELLAQTLEDDRHKDNIFFWHMAGRIYLEDGNNPKAREFFSAILKINSNDLYALKGMTHSYKNEKNWPMTTQYAEKVRAVTRTSSETSAKSGNGWQVRQEQPH